MDLIERQKAIDCVKPYGYGNSVSERTVIDCIIEAINELPSAEPEIIRCRDCEHYSGSYCHYKYAYGAYVRDNHYCGWAERRTDG